MRKLIKDQNARTIEAAVWLMDKRSCTTVDMRTVWNRVESLAGGEIFKELGLYATKAGAGKTMVAQGVTRY